MFNKTFSILFIKPFLFFIPFLVAFGSVSGQPAKKAGQKYNAYLFAYFTGNDKSQESIHFALSADGLRYFALNKNHPVLNSAEISSTGGVRDPHILRGANGHSFYMVATDMVAAKGWDSNRGIVLLKSNDLIHWESAKINIPKLFPAFANVNRVWAPQTIFDEKTGRYMIYFSMRSGYEPDKIYYSYVNKDFTALESLPKQLFYNPSGGACIDGDIIEKSGRFYLFFKTEGAGAGIEIAVSEHLTTGYTLEDHFVQQTADPVEGSGVFKLNHGSGYILMYDLYTKGRYQFTRTTDLKTFKIVDEEVSMNFHPRHGTVIPLLDNEVKALLAQWGKPEDILETVGAKGLKPRNIVIDTLQHTLALPFLPGTDLKAVKLNFTELPVVKIKPAGSIDLSNKPITLQVTVPGHQTTTYQVSANTNHNPVLPGYYADPEILYAKKTGMLYIYPTTDGFNGWSSTYFKVFSSPDLVSWKDGGTILTLSKDVKWANRNAWAPCIVEKEINGVFKYFYYYSAAQKIGVAVADNPEGPFVDSGRPIVDKRPTQIKGGQEIDPAVFTDPQTGKSYLYWGNGYMAGAELNEDMITIKPETTTILTPNTSFREGTYVFYRKGKYYFNWSEDDTRSENYQVHFGIADSPLGKIVCPHDNLVLAKDAKSGIFGTGHNAVIQIPGKDEWN